MNGVTQRVFGMTRKELAIAIGVRVSTISNWFAGTTRPTMNLHQMKALLNTTGLTLDELIQVLDPDGKL